MTGSVLGQVPDMRAGDTEAAVTAASEAFTTWQNTTAKERSNLLRAWYNLCVSHAEDLASLLTAEQGKPLTEARGEIGYGNSFIEWFSEEARRVGGEVAASPTNTKEMLFIRQPIGVAAMITPWNFPNAMITRKVGAALAAGCTLVLKPAEQTPLTALYLASLSLEVGFPPGVINVIPGFGRTAGAALTAHPHVDKIAFTGSTVVGKMIQAACAQSNLKRCTLELGGKSPLVVFDDVEDLNEAVNICYESVFTNAGQCCCASSRTFVQAGIYDKFVARAVELAKERKVGAQWEDVQQGPQVDRKQFEKVLSLIETGKKEGAKLECGGERMGSKGYFVQPTVFSGVEDNMTIAREEIFGPVQSIFKFTTMEEVIERANDTTYGLAAGVLTTNINNALTFAQAVQAGSVWVNCFLANMPQTPFGGFKQSGTGRELGPEGCLAYLENKTITIAMKQKNS